MHVAAATASIAAKRQRLYQLCVELARDASSPEICNTSRYPSRSPTNYSILTATATKRFSRSLALLSAIRKLSLSLSLSLSLAVSALAFARADKNNRTYLLDDNVSFNAVDEFRKIFLHFPPLAKHRDHAS